MDHEMDRHPERGARDSLSDQLDHMGTVTLIMDIQARYGLLTE
jgi:hypothetical protein